jgi:anti-sigma B factor antagonist
MEELRIEVGPNQGGVQIIKLTGPFTIGTMFDFQTLMREHKPPVTLIELSGVPYMDSASLGTLLGAQVSCQRENRKLALVAPSDRLKTLFEVAGVNGVLHIYPSEEAAKTAVALP